MSRRLFGEVGIRGFFGDPGREREKPRPEQTERFIDEWRALVDDYRRRDEAGEVLDGDAMAHEARRLNRIVSHLGDYSRYMYGGFTVGRAKKGIDLVLQRGQENLRIIQEMFPDLDTTDADDFDISSHTGFQHERNFPDMIEGNLQKNMSDLFSEQDQFSEGRIDKKTFDYVARSQREAIRADMLVYELLRRDMEAGALKSRKDFVELLSRFLGELGEDANYLWDLWQRSPSKRRDEAFEFFGGGRTTSDAGGRTSEYDGRGAGQRQEAPGRPEYVQPTRDIYGILGVQRGATADEVKRAYRKKAAEHHPDRGGDPKKFKEASAAYEILSDPRRRGIYDETGQVVRKETGE